MLRRLSLALTALALTAAPALAAGEPATINPGVRIGQWVTTNVSALFAPLLAAVAIYYLAKRQFTRFLSFAVFAVIAAFFIFAGDQFKDVAVGLARWVMGQ
jgi:hypothetical protein